jgi:hypothetical protein
MNCSISETTEPFERKVGFNRPWMAQYSTFMFLCTPEIQDGQLLVPDKMVFM